MLIGRSDDPQNPCRVVAFKVSVPFGSGSRNPSGPAAPTAQTGRTHDRNRTRSGFSYLTPCVNGAVHTRHKKLRYRGLAKNTAQLHTLFALANLVIVKKALLA